MKSVVVVAAVLSAAAMVAVVWSMESQWKPHAYTAVALKQDMELLLPTGEMVGILKRGTVLFPPRIEDMGVTDPGDIELHKLYVRIPVRLLRDLAQFPRDRHQTNGISYFKVLDLRPLTKN